MPRLADHMCTYHVAALAIPRCDDSPWTLRMAADLRLLRIYLSARSRDDARDVNRNLAADLKLSTQSKAPAAAQPKKSL